MSVVDQIIKQLAHWVSSPDYGEGAVREWLISPAESVQSRLSDVAQCCCSVFKKHRFLIKDVTFPEHCDSETISADLSALQKLCHIQFKNCIFECAEMEFPGITQWYEECTFNNGWRICCSEIDGTLVEPGDAQFDNCRFKKTVLINSRWVAGSSLKYFDALFCVPPASLRGFFRIT